MNINYIKINQVRSDNAIQYFLIKYDEYGYIVNRKLIATYQKNIHEGFYYNVTKKLEVLETEYTCKKHKTLMEIMYKLAEKLQIETYDFMIYNR